MEQEQTLRKMGRMLVEMMEPKTAQEKLLAIVDGADVYETIVGESTLKPEKEKKPRKKRARKERSDKGTTRAQESDMSGEEL